MGKVNGNITGTAPFGIVVRKVGENSGNRCLGSCNTFPVTFTHDEGNNEYYIIVTDSAGCVVDSRIVGGGTSNLNCDVLQPNFTAVMSQMACDFEQKFTRPILTLSNITNATRYKIWYDDPGQYPDCTSSTGFINGSSIVIELTASGFYNTDRPYWLRVYNGSDCNVYKSYSDFIHTPGPCIPPCSLSISVSNPVC